MFQFRATNLSALRCKVTWPSGTSLSTSFNIFQHLSASFSIFQRFKAEKSSQHFARLGQDLILIERAPCRSPSHSKSCIHINVIRKLFRVQKLIDMLDHVPISCPAFLHDFQRFSTIFGICLSLSLSLSAQVHVFPLADHSGTMRLAADYPVMPLQVHNKTWEVPATSFPVLSIFTYKTYKSNQLHIDMTIYIS